MTSHVDTNFQSITSPITSLVIETSQETNIEPVIETIQDTNIEPIV